MCVSLNKEFIIELVVEVWCSTWGAYVEFIGGGKEPNICL